MKIKFKRVRQATGSYCGPATLEMLLSSLGYSGDQEAIVDACGARKTVMKLGIPLPDLADGVKKLFPELRLWQKSRGKLPEVKALLDMGYLVGVDWQGMFARDEYGDDERSWWDGVMYRLKGWPELRGGEGHYCVVTEVNLKDGYVRFADPYGHYAGKERVISAWEFEERWWDDRMGKSGKEKGRYIFEDRLMFVLAKKDDQKLKRLGLRVI